jgi:hypothetical protein
MQRSEKILSLGGPGNKAIRCRCCGGNALERTHKARRKRRADKRRALQDGLAETENDARL